MEPGARKTRTVEGELSKITELGAVDTARLWQIFAGVDVVEAAVTIKEINHVLAMQWEVSSSQICVRDSQTQKQKGSEILNRSREGLM